ncbi:L,D-transpeptidase [Rhizobiaceae bacterium]|nr:L,D-transpeptidase [Rhizobiaceae bacterium]
MFASILKTAGAAALGAVILFVGAVAPASAASRDKDYWTKVWYQKEAKQGRYYKAGKKYLNGTYRKASAKRSSSKAAVSNRSTGSGVVTASIDLSSQTMYVRQGGRTLHTWPVSSGRSGYTTPTGSYKVGRMHKEYYSRKYDGAPMPYAMFFRGGYAIHGTNAISRLGQVASHGCIRLHPSNAAKLFSMVKRHGGRVKIVQ